MVANLHPSDLNPWQRFRQAGRIAFGKNKAVSAAWYQSALDLDYQIHLRTDGVQCQCFIFDRRTGDWERGPAVPGAILDGGEVAAAFATQLLELAAATAAPSVGIITYHSEDFSIAELKKSAGPQDLAEIRDEIERDPRAVIADNSISADGASWRVLPYFDLGESAAAVGIGRRWSSFLDILRHIFEERSYPLATLTLSAPLVALFALPTLKTTDVEKPIVALLPYPRFTVAGFFDMHGELLLLRTVQHRTQRGPSNLRQVLASTAAALELVTPEIHFIPTDANAEQQVAEELGLVSHFGSRETEIPGVFRYPYQVSASATSKLPLELRILTTSLGAPFDSPLGNTRTFTALREKGWAVQDFLPVAREERDLRPSLAEMRLLRFSRLLRIALLLCVTAGLLFFASQAIALFGRPEWSYKDQQGQTQKVRQMQLTQQKVKIDYWDVQLADRSRAWSAMELLPRLAARPREMLVKGFYYTAVPLSVSGQAKLGFIREWKISGYATRQELEKLSRESISTLFAGIARETGCDSYRMDLPTRSLTVNVRSQENSSYRPAAPNSSLQQPTENSFPSSFDLTITQRIENADPLAFNTGKAP